MGVSGRKEDRTGLVKKDKNQQKAQKKSRSKLEGVRKALSSGGQMPKKPNEEEHFAGGKKRSERPKLWPVGTVSGETPVSKKKRNLYPGDSTVRGGKGGTGLVKKRGRKIGRNTRLGTKSKETIEKCQYRTIKHKTAK